MTLQFYISLAHEVLELWKLKKITINVLFLPQLY